jgi:hypothetical protein
MLSRRQFLGGCAIGPLVSWESLASAAQEVADNNANVPNELGYADFSGSWNLENGSGASLIADVPDVPQGIAEKYGKVRLNTASDFADIVAGRTGRTFISWFNSEVAGVGPWKNKAISGNDAKKNFTSFWNQFLRMRPLSFLECVTYMAVFINECRGNLKNVSESYGNIDHPGISYLFDTVVLTDKSTNRTWRKASYNHTNDKKISQLSPCSTIVCTVQRLTIVAVTRLLSQRPIAYGMGTNIL